MLAGTRAFDVPELEFVRSAGIRHFTVTEIDGVRALLGPVYVHLDLDVLDPTAFGAISCAEAGGVAPSKLIEVLGILKDVIGVGIVEHSPSSATEAADAAVLQGLLAALHVGRT